VIAAVATIKGDVDIAPLTVRHFLEQGIDLVRIAVAGEEAYESLRDSGAILTRDEERWHYQQEWIDFLAALSARDGAEWIIPFDADEFWFARKGTLAECLSSIADNYSAAIASIWQHATWTHRYPSPLLGFRKVAYRWAPDRRISPGNHTLLTSSDISVIEGLLAIRHLPYRSYQQLRDKISDANAVVLPQLQAEGYSFHNGTLAELDEADLLRFWEGWQQHASVEDPIPLAPMVKSSE
jgi:hypothetical protein